MTNTYTLIASNTLTSDTASVTFSSIPSTYTDLVVKMSARNDTNTTTLLGYITFNSDTSTNYSKTRILGDGSATSSTKDSNNASTRFIGENIYTQTSNTFSNVEIYIPSYGSSNNKPFSTFGVVEDNSSTAYIEGLAGLWRGTAAITSIKIAAPSGPSSFVSGSSFFLYGISNS